MKIPVSGAVRTVCRAGELTEGEKNVTFGSGMKAQNRFANNKGQEMVLVVNNLVANAGDIRDTGLIPGLGRSPGEGYMVTHFSILAWRIPMGRGA